MQTDIQDPITDEQRAERVEQIAGLRELADFLEAHPQVKTSSLTYNVYVFTREELAAIARLGRWDKVPRGEYFSLSRAFRGDVVLDVFTDRENVCRKVVTGERLVPAQPAVDAHMEPIEEWICEDALLSKV